MTTARRQRTHDGVLQSLTEHGPLTRAELSRLTGLSRSAIATAVSLLTDEGLVAEGTHAGNTGPVSRGRRPTVVALRRRPGAVLAIDFGHAHITAVIAGTSGNLLAESSVVLDVDSQPQQALGTATELAAQALARAGHTSGEITGIAAGIPGPLDIRTQVVRAPTILREWVGLNPAEELSRRFGQPVAVANDADMGGRGEHTSAATSAPPASPWQKASGNPSTATPSLPAPLPSSSPSAHSSSAPNSSAPWQPPSSNQPSARPEP